jgi:hypothetical protein
MKKHVSQETIRVDPELGRVAIGLNRGRFGIRVKIGHFTASSALSKV